MPTFPRVVCAVHDSDTLAVKALRIIEERFEFETCIISGNTSGKGMISWCTLVLKTFHAREPVRRRGGKYLRLITKDIPLFLPHWVGEANVLMGFYPDAFYRATLEPVHFKDAVINGLSHGKVARILRGSC